MSKSGLTIDDLSENEITGLKYQVDNAHLNSPGDGISKQVLGEERNPLTKNQQYRFENDVKPTLLEKCSSCPKEVPAGVDYCPVCEIEYGG